MRKTAAALVFPILCLAACGGGGESGSPIAALWAQRAGGTGDDIAIAVATFPDGSSVVTGFFEDEATFGPGQPNETTLVSAGGDDVFVARYDADGMLLWATRAGAIPDVRAFGVAAYADGSCVISGFFDDEATFGPGEANETTVAAIGGTDCFVARYESDGSLAWARRFGGLESDQALGAGGFADGSCVVTGRFRGDATFGVGEPGETTLTSSGGADIFVARFGADGSLVWAATAGGPDEEVVAGVSTLADGSCIVGGRHAGAATFGRGETNETTLPSTGNINWLVARYAADGTLMWATHTDGGADFDASPAVAAFEDGSCVATGRFSSQATFGPGEPNETTITSAGSADCFVARFHADGTLAWAKRAGGTDHDEASCVAALPDGSSVIAGAFEGTAIFGAGESRRRSLKSDGESDAFVARFHADGSLASAASAGGAGWIRPRGLAPMADGSCLVTGRFDDTATFGSIDLVAPDDFSEIFVARVEP